MKTTRTAWRFGGNHLLAARWASLRTADAQIQFIGMIDNHRLRVVLEILSNRQRRLDARVLTVAFERLCSPPDGDTTMLWWVVQTGLRLAWNGEVLDEVGVRLVERGGPAHQEMIERALLLHPQAQLETVERLDAQGVHTRGYTYATGRQWPDACRLERVLEERYGSGVAVLALGCAPREGITFGEHVRDVLAYTETQTEAGVRLVALAVRQQLDGARNLDDLRAREIERLERDQIKIASRLIDETERGLDEVLDMAALAAA